MKHFVKTALMAFMMAIVAFAGLPSCKTPVLLQHKVTDSLQVTETIRYRDTTIVIPADSAAIQAMVDCPDLPALEVKNGRVHLKVQIKDGKLSADCKCLEHREVIALMERTLEKYRNRIETTDVPVRVGMNGFQKFFFWTGITLVTGIVIFIIVKLIKFIKQWAL